MTLFASVDTYWVGTAIGATGLAAVSTSIFWVWMLVAIAEMIGVGLTAVAARRHGERRPGEAARVVGDSVLPLSSGRRRRGRTALPRRCSPSCARRRGSALVRALLGGPTCRRAAARRFFSVDAAFARGRHAHPARASPSRSRHARPRPVSSSASGARGSRDRGAAVATVSTRPRLGRRVRAAQRRRLVAFARRASRRPRFARPATALTGGFFSVIYVLLPPRRSVRDAALAASLGPASRAAYCSPRLAPRRPRSSAKPARGRSACPARAWARGVRDLAGGAMARLMLLIPASSRTSPDDPPSSRMRRATFASRRWPGGVVSRACSRAPSRGRLHGAADCSLDDADGARLPLAAARGRCGRSASVAITSRAARGVAMRHLALGRWTKDYCYCAVPCDDFAPRLLLARLSACCSRSRAAHSWTAHDLPADVDWRSSPCALLAPLPAGTLLGTSSTRLRSSLAPRRRERRRSSWDRTTACLARVLLPGVCRRWRFRPPLPPDVHGAVFSPRGGAPSSATRASLDPRATTLWCAARGGSPPRVRRCRARIAVDRFGN